MNYALPQINQQDADAHKQMIFALSRTGNLSGSSGALDKQSELNRTYDTAKLNAGNEASNLEAQARQNVENTRSGLVAELNATGDDAAAASAATRAAANVTMPTSFSPLTNAFADFMNSLRLIGSNAGNGYSGFVGNNGPIVSPGIGSGSMTVIH